ncbi:hypothetical protein HDU78_000371, partial [Chytriomyces hyalinus]
MNLLETQFTMLNATMECKKLVIAHRHSLPFMQLLVKNISHFALDKMLRQYEEVLKRMELDQCTGGFQRIYGLPCKHEISIKVQERGQFTLNDVHAQWSLQQNPLFNTVLPLPPIVSAPLSPRSKALQQIKEKMYAIDDDQVPTLLAHLQEVTESPAQSLLNPVPLTKKRGRPAGLVKRANQRDKSQFEYVTGN